MRVYIFLSYLVVLSLFALAISNTRVGAAENATLYDAADPTIHQVREYPVNTKPEEFSPTSENIFCQPQKLVTKPGFKPFSLNIQQEVSAKYCVAQTPYGTSEGKLLQTPGSKVAGTMALPNAGNAARLIGSPNSETGVMLDPSGTIRGSKVSLLKQISANLKTTAKPDGTIEHDLKNAQKTDLFADANNRLTFEWGTYSFAANGKWLVGEMPNVGQHRVNLDSGKVNFIGKIWDYRSLDPWIKTAISPNGQYVVVMSERSKTVYMYNLSGCDFASTKPCEKKDITNKIVGKLGADKAYGPLRLLDNESLLFYTAEWVEPNKSVYKKYILSSNPDGIYKYDYIALGDSFASGEGAFEYFQYTDNLPINSCHLSSISYPYLLASRLGLSSSGSVACSGAVIDDLDSLNEDYEGQTKDGKTLSTIDIEHTLSAFLVGDLPQQRFIEKYRPKTVTVSIGGNNIGFGKKLAKCVLPQWRGEVPVDTTCFDTYEEKKGVFEEIKNLIPLLIGAYQKLKVADSNVYVLGYPKIIAPEGACGLNVPLDNSERQFADSLTELLNSAIRYSAGQAGVYYVDIENALQGYRLCEGKPDNIAVHGITAGDDRVTIPVIDRNILGAESFHPNARGNELLKAAILEKTNNFTASFSDLYDNPVFEEPAPDHPYYRGVTKTTDPLFIPRFVNTGINSVIKNTSKKIIFPGENSGLAPNQNYRVELHSTPVYLGDAVTDSRGDITFDLNVPADVPAGLHSLHFYGYDNGGQPVDLYSYLYVHESENNFNGAGEPNSGKKCLGVAPSGLDVDTDGKDDACDGYIGVPLPPTLEENAPSPPDSSSPDTISGVNQDQSTSTQGASAGNNLQPQASSTQPTAGDLQTAGQAQAGQSTNESSQNLLNQGINGGLQVVTAPYGNSSTSVPAQAPPTNEVKNDEGFGGLELAVLIGAFVLIAVILSVYKKMGSENFEEEIAAVKTTKTKKKSKKSTTKRKRKAHHR